MKKFKTLDDLWESDVVLAAPAPGNVAALVDKMAKAAKEMEGGGDDIAAALAAAWLSGAGNRKVEAGGWREIGGNPVYIENPRNSSPSDKTADSYRDPKKASGDSKGAHASESTHTAKSRSSGGAMTDKLKIDRPTDIKHPGKPLEVSPRGLRLNGYFVADAKQIASPSPLTADQIKAVQQAGKDPAEYVAVGKASLHRDLAEWAKQGQSEASANETANASDLAELKRVNVPGLDELEKASIDMDRYQLAFERMMDDEGNDGVRPPKLPESEMDALVQKYPRAAAYRLADAYTNASNDKKASAGKKALNRILMGEDAAEAIKEMQSWATGNIWD